MQNNRMKIFIALLIVVFSSLSVSADTSTDYSKDFSVNKSQADSLYNKEQYDKAAEIYSYIIDHQGTAPELYYNLGNCYFRLDSIALAILNYERALKLDPSDSDTRNNLSIARSKIKDKSTEPSEFFILAWWYSIVNKFSMTFWKILGFIFFLITLAGIITYSITDKHKNIVKYIFISSFVLSIIFNLAAWYQYNLGIDNKAAIVTTEIVSVKSSPSSSSSDLFVLHSGSRLTIIDNIKEWSEVRFEEGKEGWVNNKDITII